MAEENSKVANIIASQFNDEYIPTHQLGPVHIIETENYCTWLPNGTVKIDLQQYVPRFFKPVSVVTFMKQIVDVYPNHTALAIKRNGQWNMWTYKNYWKDVTLAAKGFIKLGLIPLHGVVILGSNSPECVISYLAAIFAGGFAVPVNPKISKQNLLNILSETSANIVIVDNDDQLEKILTIKEELSSVKFFIKCTGKTEHPNVIKWEDLLAVGKSLPDEFLNKRLNGIAINQCASAVYTSGSSGKFRGILLSHDNLIFMIKSVTKFGFGLDVGNEIGLSHLPQSQIIGIINDIYLAVLGASTVHFPSCSTSKIQIMDAVGEFQPTTLVGSPQTYKELYEKLIETESKLKSTSRNIMGWARKQSLKHYFSNRNSSQKTFGYVVAKKMVCQKMKKALGLHRTNVFVCGGAPISAELQKYLVSMDILVIEGYGFAECSGFHIVNSKDNFSVDSAGNVHIIPDMTVKIKDKDDKGNGEILLKGRNIFMGYLGLEYETKAAIDEDSWLHTGDIGKIENDLLFVTGRIEDFIVTSDGEIIAPLPIEETIKQLLAVVSGCILIGENRKYLTMLIALKMEPAEGEAIELSPIVKSWCQTVGSESEDISQILNDEKVLTAVQSAIDRYNIEFAISELHEIVKWKILDKDLFNSTEASGIPNRSCINKTYSGLIESMYAEEL